MSLSDTSHRRTADVGGDPAAPRDVSHPWSHGSSIQPSSIQPSSIQPSSIHARFGTNRFELKFVLRHDAAARVEDALQAWVRPDDITGSAAYPVTSLYYDTRDLRCYWEKLDGIKERHKVRIRHYLPGPVHPGDGVFVEIKSRHDRVTWKERVALTLEEALGLCDRWVEPEHLDAADRAVASRVLGIVQLGPMQPTALTRYVRTAYRGSEIDPTLRITFDRAVRSSTSHLDLTEQAALSPLLPADAVVLEVKVDDRLPRWLADLVGRHGLQLVRLSKYARAVEVGRRSTSTTTTVAAATA